jgi:hypothetical protein
MALEKVTVLNEFFVRMTDDGTAIQGVHVADMERILEDGAVISSKMLPPRAVSAHDAAALGPVADAFNLASLATVGSQAEQIATLAADKAAAEAARDSALAEKQSLADQLAALQPVIDGVPQFVKKWQLWAGLRMDDPTLATYNAVKAYTASFTGALKDLWDDSTGVERTAPALDGFKSGFGKTDADLDDMFTRYAAITQADVVALG